MNTIVETWRQYSVAERDRRWNAVRAGAAKAGLDCIFVPLGNSIDARYLTQIRGAVQSAAIVLPTDGREPIVITEYGTNNWIAAPHAVRRAWSEPLAQMLLDAGMERARIGVVGLKGGIYSHVRSPDGVVNESSFAHVMSRLPKATFEDATDIVGAVRFVKSDEEIEQLRRGAEIAELAIDAMARAAAPGVDAALLYAVAMEQMLERGCEFYPLALYIQQISESQGRRWTNPPHGIRLREGSLILNEVSAVWGHQVAQEDQPVLLGAIPETWKPVVELQRDVFYAGLERLKPGVTFGELNDFISGYGGGRGRTLTLMHGRGYGDDGPLIIRSQLPSSEGRAGVERLELQEGNVFTFKPIAQSADGQIEFTWGGDVVVTASGGKPLFRREHGMIEIR
jgi:Xaa-Pro dipeptidase